MLPLCCSLLQRLRVLVCNLLLAACSLLLVACSLLSLLLRHACRLPVPLARTCSLLLPVAGTWCCLQGARGCSPAASCCRRSVCSPPRLLLASSLLPLLFACSLLLAWNLPCKLLLLACLLQQQQQQQQQLQQLPCNRTNGSYSRKLLEPHSEGPQLLEVPAPIKVVGCRHRSPYPRLPGLVCSGFRRSNGKVDSAARSS